MYGRIHDLNALTQILVNGIGSIVFLHVVTTDATFTGTDGLPHGHTDVRRNSFAITGCVGHATGGRVRLKVLCNNQFCLELNLRTKLLKRPSRLL